MTAVSGERRSWAAVARNASIRRLASRAASSSARAASRSRTRRLRSVRSCSTLTAPTSRPSRSRSGATAEVDLDLPPIQRPHPEVAHLLPAPQLGPRLPPQGAHDRQLLGGHRTALLVARGIPCQPLAQRQLPEAGRGGVQAEDAAGRRVLAHRPPLRVIHEPARPRPPRRCGPAARRPVRPVRGRPRARAPAACARSRRAAPRRRPRYARPAPGRAAGRR